MEGKDEDEEKGVDVGEEKEKEGDKLVGGEEDDGGREGNGRIGGVDE